MTRDIIPAHLQQILALHAEGRSTRYIALHVPVSRGTVRAILRDLRPGRQPPANWVEIALHGKRPYWPNGRDQDLALRVKTQRVGQIARAYNISTHMIYRKLKELGIEPPRVQQSEHVRPERVVLVPVSFPTFTDHPNGDKDRHMGRRPQKQYAISLTGNAGALCCG